MDDWLEDAQEAWWNGLTDEEKEHERADAIMEARRCEELEEMCKYDEIHHLGGGYPCIPDGDELHDDVTTADTDEIPW